MLDEQASLPFVVSFLAIAALTLRFSMIQVRGSPPSQHSRSSSLCALSLPLARMHAHCRILKLILILPHLHTDATTPPHTHTRTIPWNGHRRTLMQSGDKTAGDSSRKRSMRRSALHARLHVHVFSTTKTPFSACVRNIRACSNL